MLKWVDDLLLSLNNAINPLLKAKATTQHTTNPLTFLKEKESAVSEKSFFSQTLR